TVATYSGSFSLHYDIQQAKYDMSKVKWNYTDGALKYNGKTQSVELSIPNEAPYSALSVKEYDGNEYRNAKQDYVASVLEFNNTDSNYITPILNKPDTYEGDFDWTLTWSIGKGELTLEWASTDIGKDFKVLQVTGTNAQYVDATKYKYYRSNGASVGDEISLDVIEIGDGAVRYWVEAVLTDNAALNYEISQTSKIKSFKVGSDNEKITVELSASSFTYDGNTHGGELRVTTGVLDIGRINKTYYRGSVSPENKLDKAPTDAGNYIVVLSLSEEDEEEYALAQSQIPYSIAKAKIKAVWDNSGQIPEIANLSEMQKQAVGYIYYDADGNQLPDGAQLEAGKSYKVKAILTGANVNNYEFVSESGEVLPSATQTGEEEFTVKSNGGHGNNVGIGEDGESFNEIWQKLKEIPLWQIIAGVISIILTIVFLSKTASYDNKRKKFVKKADKLNMAYAGAYLGIATTIWTAIACVLIGLAVMSLVMMLISKSRCNKAEEEYEERLEEYNRNQKELDERKRDESMRMMLMGMMGGNNGGQGGYMGGYGMGIDEMRGLISDAVAGLLPNMQQALPQQASSNDELVEKLLEKTAKNEDTIQKLMKKIAEQPTEKIVEPVVAREVASANANDETIKSLVEGQKEIKQQLAEIAKSQNAEPQVVEKIVEVPVEVEKIVEKEVVKEVPVESEKEIKEKPKKKEVAPRLTLDEAYAQLSKQQQKYFDGLRQYALSKPNSKEKKSTYFTVFGQSTVNPLMKLTIKKDTVVALFKMEDEYMKDIRKDATSDGTKIKVKETEVVISDAQACKAAKNMIDLREDQIERYQDLLKEQRAMKNKK
ncbi:MAG: hypothetical protein K2I23_06930, partial [Clostridia bacterium]|nr:hypothetical protein [Clostridia bacterium]